MADACRQVNVPVRIVPLHQADWRHPVATWRCHRTWRGVLRQHPPALVHANSMEAARSICTASRRASLPLVCHVRFGAEPSYVEWVFRRLPKPDLFIFNSHALRGEVGPRLEAACPTSNQAVVHNAVRLDQFRPRPPQTPEQVRVGILANLLPVKGHMDFLEMAHILTCRGVSAQYWIIGYDHQESGYDKKLEARAAELGLPPRVRFLGHVRDVPKKLESLAVLVCASHVEPFGRCLIEAMACELPVVATRVGGIPEVVDDGVTGLLVDPKAPDQLADAVQKLLANPSQRRRMGRAARQRAQALFSPDKHAQAIVSLYQTLLNR